MSKRKPVYLSNLAMRFYKKDGWTKKLLDTCCVKGEVHCFHPDDVGPYYTLDHRIGSQFDVVKLVDLVSEIVPPGFWTRSEWREFYRKSPEQIIEEYNW